MIRIILSEHWRELRTSAPDPDVAADQDGGVPRRYGYAVQVAVSLTA